MNFKGSRRKPVVQDQVPSVPLPGLYVTIERYVRHDHRPKSVRLHNTGLGPIGRIHIVRVAVITLSVPQHVDTEVVVKEPVAGSNDEPVVAVLAALLGIPRLCQNVRLESFRRFPQLHIDIAADRVGVHIRGERFVDLHGLDHVRRDHREVHASIVVDRAGRATL